MEHLTRLETLKLGFSKIKGRKNLEVLSTSLGKLIYLKRLDLNLSESGNENIDFFLNEFSRELVHLACLNSLKLNFGGNVASDICYLKIARVLPELRELKEVVIDITKPQTKYLSISYEKIKKMALYEREERRWETEANFAFYISKMKDVSFKLIGGSLTGKKKRDSELKSSSIYLSKVFGSQFPSEEQKSSLS